MRCPSEISFLIFPCCILFAAACTAGCSSQGSPGNLVRGTKHFVWFENYRELLGDSVFTTSLVNTLRYTLLCLVFQFAVGFALALFFSSKDSL